MDNLKVQESKRRTSPLKRASFMASFGAALNQVLIERRSLKYRAIFDGKILDLTPREMPIIHSYAEKLKALHNKVNEFTSGGKKQNVLSAPTSQMGSLRGARTMGGLKLTISDILEGVPSFKLLYTKPEIDDLESIYDFSIIQRTPLPQFKVSLHKTNPIVLYEQNSTAVLKDSNEASEVEYDNRVYDHLTTGPSSLRLRHDAEAQTKRVLTFNRKVGTKHIPHEDENTSYSQNMELKALELSTEQLKGIKSKDSSISNLLMENENFQLAVMRTERALEYNYHIRAQMRYRNIYPKKEDAVGLNLEPTFRYNAHELFRFAQPDFALVGKEQANVRKAVSAISFCCGNPDLIAVGYGIYSYAAQAQTKSGNVCVWSIKNPQNPERTYSYKSPVSAVEFSPFSHSLLAVGTSKGWVEVRDITTQHKTPLAAMNRADNSSCEPIIAIKFYYTSQSVYANYNQFLTFQMSSNVLKFRFRIGPELFCVHLTTLDRVMGKIEGLPVIGDLRSKKLLVRRRPIGLNLCLDMINDDSFYLLTDQGCIHNASMRHMNTYDTTFRTHRGAVNCMEFSPWSPKVYLTCGNDWYIRIWMIGILEPLCELTYNMAPINHAAWSPTHSHIILALNRDTLDIWDLRSDLFKPKRSISFEKGFNTLFKFSPSGTTIVIGKESGDVIVCALDEMPPEPHYQYDTLASVLYDAIESDSVRQQYKESGFFGYPKKWSRKAFPKIYARI